MSEPDDKVSVLSYAKRLAEIRRLIVDYTDFQKENGIDITFMEEAEVRLTNFYFKVLSKEVWPLMPKKVNRYKIGAITELCIVSLQPIVGSNESDSRRLNGEFALYCSMSFIGSFPLTKTLYEKVVVPDGLVTAGMRILKQHKNWLITKERDSFPIFSNGSFWYAVHHLLVNDLPFSGRQKTDQSKEGFEKLV